MIKQGNIFNNGVQVFLTSLSSYFLMFDKAQEFYSFDELKEMFFNFFIDDMNLICRDLKNENKLFRFNLLTFIERINCIGVGALKVIYFSNKKFKFSLDKSYFNKNYNVISSNKNELSLEIYYFAILKSFFSVYFQKKVEINMEFGLKKTFFCVNVLEDEVNLISEKRYEFEKFNKIEISPLNRIFYEKGLILDDGSFTVFGLKTCSFPQLTHVNFLIGISDNEDFVNFHLRVCYWIGRSYVDIQKNFGQNLGLSCFEWILHSFDLTGFGQLELVEENNHRKIRVKSFMTETVKKHYNDLINFNYLRFVAEHVRGFYEACLNEKVIVNILSDDTFELVDGECEKGVSELEDKMIKESFRFQNLLVIRN